MPFAAPDFYTVHYQAQPPLVRGLVARPLSAPEFTVACEMLLALAKKHRCPYWLLDGRADENTRPTALLEWLMEDFMPRVPKALRQMPYLAFVAQARFWEGFQARYRVPVASALVSPAFRAEAFTGEAAARAWLDSCRPPS